MKIWKSLLIALMILVNLVYAPPSLADRPKFTSNPDYVKVTKSLDTLSQVQKNKTEVEGVTPEEIQNKIDELTFQKYALETGINWGQCRNETGKALAVYGRNPGKKNKKKDIYDNGLYFLADGQSTASEWDCDGFYIPNDVKLGGLAADGQAQEFTEPVALKIPDGSQLVIKTNPDTAAIEVNLPNAQVVKANEVNWFIPNVSQAFIDTRVANAPTQKS